MITDQAIIKYDAPAVAFVDSGFWPSDLVAMQSNIATSQSDIATIQAQIAAAQSGTTDEYMRGDGTLGADSVFEPAITPGTSAQYYRGDKVWAAFPSIPTPQVQTDWNATSGMGVLLNKPFLAPVATSGAYSDLTGKPTLGTAAAQNTTAFDASGAASSAQAFAIQRANHTGTQLASTVSDFSSAALSVVTWSTLTGKPSFATVATSGAYGDLSGRPTLGTAASQNSTVFEAAITDGTSAQYWRGDKTWVTFPTIPSNTNQLTNGAAFVDQAGARSSISLTTTGTSGAASYNSSTGVFNIPNYAPGTGTVTSVTAGTGLSGGTFTTNGTISMPNTGTAGTYVTVTTDTQGRVTSGLAVVQNDNVARTLNSNYTISATQRVRCTYSINVTWALASLLSGSGSAFLEYSTNAGSTWTTVSTVSKSLSLLTIAGGDDMNLSGEVPANALVRIRTTATNMTVAYTRGQEVLC